MTSYRNRLFSRRISLILAGSLILVGTAGCTASADVAESNATPPPVSEIPASANSTAAEDEVTCAAMSDVSTILHNAQAAFYSDRMTQGELNGWAALASRVLGNIPSADEGRVADALTDVKEAVPAVEDPLGPSNIISQEWNAAGAELLAACEAAGFPVYATGFVGG